MAAQSTESKRQAEETTEAIGGAASNAGSAEPSAAGSSMATSGQGEKVDSAFELMEQLEKTRDGQYAAEEAETPESSSQGRAFSRSGLRVNFSVAALISEADTPTAPDKATIRAGESRLFNLDLTLPYVWQIPLVGPTALKFVRYFQKNEEPESLRGILQSLRRKSRL